MTNFISAWFENEMFMPHGQCYLWKPQILWLHVLSDGLIALAYFIIPTVLMLKLYRVPDPSARWIVVTFSLFISVCGVTHLLDIWTVWHPDYFLQGIIKAITAGLSIATSMLILPLAIRMGQTMRGDRGGRE